MNKLAAISIISILSVGCVCDASCPTITLQDLSISSQSKRIFSVNEPMRFDYTFLTHSSTPKKKWHCVGTRKELCLGSVNEAVFNDSTSLICNKDLSINSTTYNANSNLLRIPNITQSIIQPDPLLSSNGRYQLDLSQFTFSPSDLQSPYVFSIAEKTNKRYYADTIIITINP
ncbi:MAG: hypothetical protein V4613_01600 [Bacteroidota bacterium]